METERLNEEVKKAENQFVETRDRLVRKYTDYIIRALNEIRDGKRPDIVVKTLTHGEFHFTRDSLRNAHPGEDYLRVTSHPRLGDTLLPLSTVINMSLGNLEESGNLYRQFKTQEEAVSKK